MKKAKKVLKTVDIIEEMKGQLAIERGVDEVSDYYIAKVLQIRPQTVSNWRHKGKVMSSEVAINAAKIAKLDPEFLFACLEAERAQKVGDVESSVIWGNLANAYRKIAAPAITGLAAIIAINIDPRLFF